MDGPDLRTEIGKRNPFDCPEQEVHLNLVRSADHVQAEAQHLLSGHGISKQQYNVLRILRGHGGAGVPSQVVASQMLTRTPDLTRLVDCLVETGLAVRERTAADRRVVLVRITPAGLDLLARLDEPILAMHRRQLAHLAPEELHELNRLLVKLRHPPSPPGPATSD